MQEPAKDTSKPLCDDYAFCVVYTATLILLCRHYLGELLTLTSHKKQLKETMC